MVCTLHHRGLTPHLSSLHQGTRATSIRDSNLTTRLRRRGHMRGMTTATNTVVMRTLELDSSKDVWPLFAAAACWRSAASKENKCHQKILFLALCNLCILIICSMDLQLNFSASS